jgi:hypothetical protein
VGPKFSTPFSAAGWHLDDTSSARLRILSTLVEGGYIPAGVVGAPGIPPRTGESAQWGSWTEEQL